MEDITKIAKKVAKDFLDTTNPKRYSKRSDYSERDDLPWDKRAVKSYKRYDYTIGDYPIKMDIAETGDRYEILIDIFNPDGVPLGGSRCPKISDDELTKALCDLVGRVQNGNA